MMRIRFLLVLAVVALCAPLATSPAPRPQGPQRPEAVSPEVWARMAPIHQRMLAHQAEHAARGALHQITCFAPGTDAELVEAFQVAVFGQEYQLNNRWTQTALGSGGGQGDPTTLTYGFVADGTLIPGQAGEPSGPSNLQATFDAAFGSTAAWRALFDQVFQRWSEVTGITYVFEPNDDGAAVGSLPGVAGVRADLRISGHLIDGQSGILAYNPFPPDGDMVLDTGDIANYADPAGNFLFLRNVVAHEHGHGQGLLHTCPTDNTKLMEPFINLNFDGPRTDDILGSQRLYGDRLEPNDSIANAHDLGLLNGALTLDDVSIDDDQDVDVYKVTLPQNVDLDLLLRPVGGTYLEGPQSFFGNCTPGTSFSASSQVDLRLQLIAPDENTVLLDLDAAGLGGNESIQDFFVSGNDDYFLRISGPQNAAQLYELTLAATPGTPPAFGLELPAPPPSRLRPDEATDFLVTVVPGSGAPDLAGATLFTRVGAGVFQPSPMTQVGTGELRATLPAIPCFSGLEYYVEVPPVGAGNPVRLPFSGEFSAVADLGLQVVLSDDFDTDLGWTVTNDAALTDGAWQRGVPLGGGDRGDPAAAFGGSGSCYGTDLADGNSDVDGGSTSLTSPVLDLSGASAARVSFRLWFDNDFGSNPGTDPFVVELSRNGGSTWQTVFTTNQSPDAWIPVSLRLDVFGPLTSAMRLRFIASDPPPGAVVEAGLDAFVVEACPTVTAPPALGPAADGSFPISTLLVNGRDGGADHRVEVLREGAFSLEIQAPGATPSDYLLFASLGIAGPADALSVPGVGTFAFPPCVLAPGDPNGFLLLESFPSGFCGGGALLGSPAPFSVLLLTPDTALDLTLQGVVLTGGGAGTTNAILLRIR